MKLFNQFYALSFALLWTLQGVLTLTESGGPTSSSENIQISPISEKESIKLDSNSIDEDIAELLSEFSGKPKSVSSAQETSTIKKELTSDGPKSGLNHQTSLLPKTDSGKESENTQTESPKSILTQEHSQDSSLISKNKEPEKPDCGCGTKKNDTSPIDDTSKSTIKDPEKEITSAETATNTTNTTEPSSSSQLQTNSSVTKNETDSDSQKIQGDTLKSTTKQDPPNEAQAKAHELKNGTSTNGNGTNISCRVVQSTLSPHMGSFKRKCVCICPKSLQNESIDTLKRRLDKIVHDLTHENGTMTKSPEKETHGAVPESSTTLNKTGYTEQPKKSAREPMWKKRLFSHVSVVDEGDGWKSVSKSAEDNGPMFKIAWKPVDSGQRAADSNYILAGASLDSPISVKGIKLYKILRAFLYNKFVFCPEIGHQEMKTGIMVSFKHRLILTSNNLIQFKQLRLSYDHEGQLKVVLDGKIYSYNKKLSSAQLLTLTNDSITLDPFEITFELDRGGSYKLVLSKADNSDIFSIHLLGSSSEVIELDHLGKDIDKETHQEQWIAYSKLEGSLYARMSLPLPSHEQKQLLNFLIKKGKVPFQ